MLWEMPSWLALALMAAAAFLFFRQMTRTGKPERHNDDEEPLNLELADDELETHEVEERPEARRRKTVPPPLPNRPFPNAERPRL